MVQGNRRRVGLAGDEIVRIELDASATEAARRRVDDS